jgi:hypothetical protein
MSGKDVAQYTVSRKPAIFYLSPSVLWYRPSTMQQVITGRPFAIRALNGAGRLLRVAGLSPVRLGEESLLARAAQATSLSDFGDDHFRHGLRRYLDALEKEARLTLLGRVIARGDTSRLLENRLHLVNAYKLYPEIGAEEIRRPIFILGLPRTGTSILHELLAQDPANRVPMTWEVYRVWPPPERATYETDPRIAEVDRHLSGVDRIMPGFKQMHPMGALLPQECVALTAHDFATMMFHTTHNVPSYEAWLEDSDLRPVYASHRRQLQYLQWRCPARRWVLKSPGHLWALDSLLAVYPDARIIQTHRDPAEVIASLTSLITYLRSMASDRVDPFEIGADWTERLARGLRATMQIRDRESLGSDRVFDVRFRSFLGNEIETVRRIYENFDLEWTEEAEMRMRRFLAANPQDKHGAHRYTLMQAGLDAETERRRFAFYCDRYIQTDRSDEIGAAR